MLFRSAKSGAPAAAWRLSLQRGLGHCNGGQDGRHGTWPPTTCSWGRRSLSFAAHLVLALRAYAIPRSQSTSSSSLDSPACRPVWATREGGQGRGIHKVQRALLFQGRGRRYCLGQMTSPIRRSPALRIAFAGRFCGDLSPTSRPSRLSGAMIRPAAKLSPATTPLPVDPCIAGYPARW